MLNKFIIDDYHLIVLNDAKNPEIQKNIEDICDKYEAFCVRFQPDWHDFDSPLNSYIKSLVDQHPALINDQNSPSWRHSRMIKYALELFGYNHDDLVVLLDGDAFPIRPISFQLWLANHEIVASIRKGINCSYFYPVFVAFDPRKLENPNELNLSWDYIHGYIQDTGAASYRYMEAHPEIKILKVPFIPSNKLELWGENQYKNYKLDSRSIQLINKLRGYYYETHMNFHILHYKGSSHRHIRPEKDRLIIEFLNDCLNSNFPPFQNLHNYSIPIEFPGDD